MLSGLLIPLAAQMDQRNYSETQKQLGDIRETLLGFALSKGATGKPYLPCPDTTGDGVGDRTTPPNCDSPEGDLPWAELGLPSTDNWTNHYRYRVTSAFSNNTTGFTLSSTGAISIKDGAAGNTIASNVPVVVYSRGKNGAGTGTDEAENSNNDDIFVSRIPSATGGNEFDDLVVWIPAGILFNREVAAGQLP
jgi:hypothetical protein